MFRIGRHEIYIGVQKHSFCTLACSQTLLPTTVCNWRYVYWHTLPSVHNHMCTSYPPTLLLPTYYHRCNQSHLLLVHIDHRRRLRQGQSYKMGSRQLVQLPFSRNWKLLIELTITWYAHESSFSPIPTYSFHFTDDRDHYPRIWRDMQMTARRLRCGGLQWRPVISHVNAGIGNVCGNLHQVQCCLFKSSTLPCITLKHVTWQWLNW